MIFQKSSQMKLCPEACVIYDICGRDIISLTHCSGPPLSIIWFRCCFGMRRTTSTVPLGRQTGSLSSVLSMSAQTDLCLYLLTSRTAPSSSCLLIITCLDIPLETVWSGTIAVWNYCCNNGTLIKDIPSLVNPNKSCVQTQGWISLGCLRGMKNGDQHCKQHPEE